MKIARFNGGRIGIVRDNTIVDVSAAAGVDPAAWPPVGIVSLIANFAAHKGALEAAVAKGPAVPLESVRLEAPIPWPRNLLALPSNYADHAAEMKGRAYAVAGSGSPNAIGFFMKAGSSIVGPADELVLPNRSDREFHHECELAIVVGKRARHIKAADALDYIFGYMCLIDATMRGLEERVLRKSFETFTPTGPYITTADEVGPTDELKLQLWVNGDLRQHAQVKQMIVGIRETIELCSAVTTLEPGDVIATGTMSGVGPVKAGDTVKIDIERVGTMSIPVRVGKESWSLKEERKIGPPPVTTPA